MRNKGLFWSKNIAFVFVCLCQLFFINANSDIDKMPEKCINETNEINTELDHKNGIRITLEIAIPEFVAGLVNEPGIQKFKKPYDAAVKLLSKGENNFIDLFVAEFEKQNEGVLLAPLFSRCIAFDLSRYSSNAEVLDWLKIEKRKALDHIIIIFERRANEFGLAKPTILIQPATSRIFIELQGIGDSESIRNKIETIANIGFYEIYENKTNGIAGVLLLGESDLSAALFGKEFKSNNSESETADVLLSDADRKKRFPISSILNLAFKFDESGQIFDYQEGSIIGYAEVKDTAELNFRLNHELTRINLPLDLYFMWDSKEIENDGQPSGTLALHAIKVPLYGPRVDGRDIQRASVNGHITDQYSLDLLMNDLGAIKWKEMTADNLNKQIAIIMDNSVLSAPVVNEVMDKNSSILGNFTLLEAKELAALINAGPLPAPVKIVQIDKL